MPTKLLTPLPATYHPRRHVDAVELGQVHDQPADPARVTPAHLPALCNAAADLDGLPAPIRITAPAQLERCTDCAAGDDIPETGAVATVIGYDPYGHPHADVVCALHVDGAIRFHNRLNRAVVVEVPAASRQWFARCDRETFWALDEARGVAVVRDFTDAWTVVDVVDGVPSALVARFPLLPGEGYAGARARAELVGQAYAATLAADAYEPGFALADTVALPVAAIVTEVAA